MGRCVLRSTRNDLVDLFLAKTTLSMGLGSLFAKYLACRTRLGQLMQTHLRELTRDLCKKPLCTVTSSELGSAPGLGGTALIEVHGGKLLHFSHPGTGKLPLGGAYPFDDRIERGDAVNLTRPDHSDGQCAQAGDAFGQSDPLAAVLFQIAPQ